MNIVFLMMSFFYSMVQCCKENLPCRVDTTSSAYLYMHVCTYNMFLMFFLILCFSVEKKTFRGGLIQQAVHTYTCMYVHTNMFLILFFVPDVLFNPLFQCGEEAFHGGQDDASDHGPIA
jgi:hypothetical protein